MKTDPRPEIVEIIDDERDVFVGGTVHHDTPNRRWVGPVAATVLLAAIGYSVVTSATSSGGRVTLPTTIATTPTTVGAATTIARPAAKVVNAQYYVAQPPPFSMHFAETLGMGGNPADFTTSAIAELWATREATAVTGSWFVVSLGTHHFTGRNSYRTVVGNLAVVVEHDLASGQSRLSFTKAGDELEITAFGWADRQLLRLVKSVRRRESEFVWEDQFFTTDHTRLFGGDPSTRSTAWWWPESATPLRYRRRSGST